MGVAYSLPVSRIKLSVFVRDYFKDEESRPTTATIKNHIKAGLLSGKKIGGAWYVECTVWGEPLFYKDKKTLPSTSTTQPTITGNSKADAILKKWVNTHGSTTTTERAT